MYYLQITLRITNENRPAAVQIYSKYKEPFLSSIPGAISKELLVREEDLQVLHGFATGEQAGSYLQSELFKNDVVAGLKPLLQSDPDVRIYQAF